MYTCFDRPDRRVIAVLLAAALPVTAGAADAAVAKAMDPTATPRPALRCEAPKLGRDALNVSCALEAGAPRRVQLRVRLTGSHDDTTGTLQVAIAGAAVTCDAGSKTSTEGEDGDVTLDCRFTAAADPGAATLVQASARWFHAQFVGFEGDAR